MKKSVSLFVLLLILSFALVSLPQIRVVKAQGVIYIRDDGSHIMDFYDQAYIFKPSVETIDIPGLPDSIMNRICFLFASNEEQIEVIATKFKIQTLVHAGRIRGWVQVFLSGEKSLFIKKNLSE